MDANVAIGYEPRANPWVHVAEECPRQGAWYSHAAGSYRHIMSPYRGVVCVTYEAFQAKDLSLAYCLPSAAQALAAYTGVGWIAEAKAYWESL